MFANARRSLEDTEIALREELCLSYDNDIIFSTEETNKIFQDFLRRANDLLEDAFNKKYN